MSAKGFPVVLEPEEDGGYVVTCPIIPGCYSQGGSLQEALDNIREAIELCLEDYRERGEAVPMIAAMGTIAPHAPNNPLPPADPLKPAEGLGRN